MSSDESTDDESGRKRESDESDESDEVIGNSSSTDSVDSHVSRVFARSRSPALLTARAASHGHVPSAILLPINTTTFTTQNTAIFWLVSSSQQGWDAGGLPNQLLFSTTVSWKESCSKCMTVSCTTGRRYTITSLVIMAESTPPHTPKKPRHIATTSQFSPSRKLVTMRDSRKQSSQSFILPLTPRPCFTPSPALPDSPPKPAPTLRSFPPPARITTASMFSPNQAAASSKIAALSLPTFSRLNPAMAIRSTILKPTAAPRTPLISDSQSTPDPPSNETEAELKAGTEDLTQQAATAKVNNKAPSAMMNEFLDKHAHPTYHDLLHLHAGPSSGPVCSQCQADSAPLYRCCDCFRRRPLCKSCILDAHSENPLHLIEEWTEAQGFWGRVTLQSLGMVIYLGHGANRCSHTFRNPRKVCLVSERGIQNVSINFCECTENGRLKQTESQQLLDVGLWPGSWKQPCTAFSLSVLDDFQLLATQGTITAQDYLTCLERKTNAVLPNDVDSRYREFLVAIREHHFIKICLRKGVLPSRELEYGSLATMCPACPHINLNISPEWRTRADDKLHLDALYYAIDGNYTLNLKDKGTDPADFPLTLGAAYFANEKDSAAYFSQMPHKKYHTSTCNKFGAMGFSGHWGSVSGMVGLSCARHMFVLPGGSVDLKVGESHDAVDFCHLSGLQKWISLRLHISAYDINCQYRIHFWERIEAIRKMLFVEKKFTLRSIKNFVFPATRAAVGKFHEAAHKLACRLWNSFHYLPGSAQTDGEALERVWPHMTALALRTREMSAGHRHDIINYFNDDMNWRKTFRMPTFLVRKHREAEKYFKESSESLSQYVADLEESGVPPGTIETWRLQKVEWEKVLLQRAENPTGDGRGKGKSKDAISPYEPASTKAATQKQVLADLENRTKAGAVELVGLQEVISEGIELQELRSCLMLQLTKNQSGRLTDEKLASMRSALSVRLAAWNQAASTTLTLAITAALHNLNDERKQRVDAEVVRRETLVVKEQMVHEKQVGSYVAKMQSAHVTSEKDDNEQVDSVKTTAEKADSSIKKRKRGTGVQQSPASRDFSIDLEEYQIHLPSSYPSDIQSHPALKDAAYIELVLRQDQADTALDDVRTHLAATFGLQTHLKKATTQQLKTRTQRPAQRVRAAVYAAANVYRRSRLAMMYLGMSEDNPTYQRLKNSHLEPFGIVREEDRRYGDSKKPKPRLWIWRTFAFIGDKEDLTQALRDTMTENLRVHWCRSTATVERWQEELEVIEEEMRRTIFFFDYHVGLWEARTKVRLRDSPGSAEYARKQVHTYTRLLTRSRESFAPYVSDAATMRCPYLLLEA
ncbi:hypothetical protein BDW22DRAFT_1485896 [Trametopsis cervina]|nr:hypothetical protein BDW22DRAFT_1485896 [Trametopsis cervina]